MKRKPVMHSNIGPVIVDLIEELEVELDQELHSHYQMDSPTSQHILPTTAPVKPLKTSIPEKSDENAETTSASAISVNKMKLPTNIHEVINNFIKKYFSTIILEISNCLI